MKAGALMNCSYMLVNRTWTCTVHLKPSKHKANSTSRYPCLEVDPWNVKELDALHERAGTYEQWIDSYRRKELSDKERNYERQQNASKHGAEHSGRNSPSI